MNSVPIPALITGGVNHGQAVQSNSLEFIAHIHFTNFRVLAEVLSHLLFPQVLARISLQVVMHPGHDAVVLVQQLAAANFRWWNGLASLAGSPASAL